MIEAATTSQIIESVYDELRRLAISYLRRERSDHTLQPTALVHEAYLSLARQDRTVWQSREHFIGIAAMMMRRVLINYAVMRKTQKRGVLIRVPLETAIELPQLDEVDLLDLDEALIRMALHYPREAQIIELKFFGGLSSGEAAQLLKVSERTVERSWTFARAWLLRELSK
jgi:RNA polymerase sigma factor (TIGR02999 family)